MKQQANLHQVQQAGQIPVDMRNAKQQSCECGCNTFIQEINIYTISAVVSPVGKELIIQKPQLVCMECRKPYDLNKTG